MTNELGGILHAVTGAIGQIERWPIPVLIVVLLILFGGFLKSIRYFPNKMIPYTVIIVGGVVNGKFGSLSNPGSFPPDINLTFVMASYGAMYGLTAVILHRLILKRYEKYVPFLNGKSGDTSMFPNPNAKPNNEKSTPPPTDPAA